MEITEAKVLKEELDRQIMKLVSDYHKNTGLRVSYIDVEYMDTQPKDGSTGFLLANVECHLTV